MTEDTHLPEDAVRELPSDVESDVVEQLSRLEHDVDRDRAVLDGDDPLATSFLGLPTDPVVPPPDTPPPMPAGAAYGRKQTLEDLYAAHPDIGQGDKCIRVQRIEPQRWGGTVIAGFLGDHYRQISMMEFANMYGGGRYKILVLGPVRSTLDASGRATMKTIDYVQLSVPGEPRLTTPMTDTMTAGPGFSSGGMPQIEMERIRADRSREERTETELRELRNQLASRGSAPPDLLKQVEVAARSRAQEVRESYQITVNGLREENKLLQEKLNARERDIQELQSKMLAVQTETQASIAKIQNESREQLTREETTRIRDIKDRHQEEMDRRKSEYGERITAMQSDHQRQIQQLLDTHSRERSDLERASRDDRVRLESEMSRREQQTSSDRARELEVAHRDRESQLTNQQRSYEGRLAEMQRTYETQLRIQSEQHMRELTMVRSEGENKATFAEKTAQLQVNMLTGEVRSLRGDKDTLSRENTGLRQQNFKSPIQAIGEARELVELVTPAGSDNGATDWKSVVAGIVRTVGEKLPEVAKTVEQVRQANRMPPPHMLPAPMPQYQAPMPAPQPRPMPRSPIPPGMVGPPPGWGEAHGHDPSMPMHVPSPMRPPGPGAAGIPTPEPARPVMLPPDPPLATTVVAPPPMPGMAPAPVAAAAAPHPVSPPPGTPPGAPPSPAASPPPAPPPPMTSPPVTPEQMEQFAKTLDDAINSNGLITPEDYAKGFQDEVGLEGSRWIVNQVQAADIANAIEQHTGRRTSIPTREGRKYLAAVWDELRKLTS